MPDDFDKLKELSKKLNYGFMTSTCKHRAIKVDHEGRVYRCCCHEDHVGKEWTVFSCTLQSCPRMK
jgi:hypothetical protein